MPYQDDINALSPDHRWSLDGDGDDDIGSANGTNTGGSFAGPPLCEDVTNSYETDSTGDRLAFPTATTLNGSAHDRKTIAGWFSVNDFQLPPKTVYREGSTGNYLQLVMWAGNKLLFDVSNSGGVNSQAISDRIFKVNRIYHICAKLEGTSFGDFVRLYIDGVLQQVTVPDSGVFGASSLNSRGVAEIGDASGGTEVGQATVLLNAPVNGRYNQWASWQGANAQLTDAEIREELFEKGAVPDVTITNQAGLDALADTLRPDAPCCIRVDVAGSISLTADNVTFDPLASIHVQYTGSGTLTWTNTNGANASIGSTTGGGSINFINPSTITTSPLIADSEVRIYEAGTTTELAGIESSGTSFSSLVTADFVDVVVLALGYQNLKIKNIDMTGGDVSLPISQVVDRQYENPSSATTTVVAIITENTTVQTETTFDNQYTGIEDNALDNTNPTLGDPDSGFWLISQNSTPEERRQLFRITGLSNIPSAATITAAFVRCSKVFANTGVITVDARRVLQSWVDGQASWNNYSTGNAWSTAGCDDDGVDRVASVIGSASWDSDDSGYMPDIDITSYVQDVVDGTISSDEGVLLSTDTVSSGGAFGVYVSSSGSDGQRPEIYVEYEI